MNEEIQDTSRLDSYMRSRQKVAFLHAVWRPLLAGAVGAALMMGCVWLILPKVSYREIVVPAVTMKDVEVPKVTMQDTIVPNIVSHDVFVDHVVTQDKIIEIPRIVETKPLTAAEQNFVNQPEYKDTEYHGRIVKPDDGVSVQFDSGLHFWPGHWDAAVGKVVPDPGKAMDTERFLGDLGYCRQDSDGHLWFCHAMHNGNDVAIPGKRRTSA